MNNFGLDHQSTFTSIVLYEGSSLQVTRMVGDGRQLVIPNVVADGELWGTQAASTFGCRPLEGIEREDSADHGIFWRGIASRLFSYIGRMDAVRENGYGVTAAISRDLDADAVASHARDAGLRDFDVIMPTDALCCRWLAGAPDWLEPQSTIVAVACGDRSIEIEAFVVERTSSRPLVVDRSGGATIEQTGHAFWSKRLVAELRERLIEPPPTALERNPDVCTAIGRAAERLTRERSSFDWNGGLGSRLFAPVRIEISACRRWPETVLLDAAMRPGIDDELRKLSAENADLILVGGIGALWPFAFDSARAIGNVWISSDPTADLAVGAATWAEAAQPIPGARPQRLIIQKSPDVPEEPPADDEPAPQPPWLQGRDAVPIEE